MHTIVGVGLANATVIEGQTGLIVVDAGDSIQLAKEQLEWIRKISAKPIRAVIYSHNHYALGAQAYLSEGGGEKVQFIAHPKLLPNMANQVADTGPAFLRGAMVQFGALLPPKGPDAFPNLGVGPYLLDLSHGVPVFGFVPPTKTVNDGEELTVDGVKLQFFWTPSDTDDTIAIYLPERKVLVANLMWPAFFNVHTLRGDRFRDPQTLLPGLRRMMALDAEVFVGVHGAPIVGREKVSQAAAAWHDGLQYVYDQTVRGINRGRSPDDLARDVKLPASIASVPVVREFYGEIPYHVRQIYTGLMGWWGGDMADAHRLHPSDEGARLLELAGGADKVEAAARAALAKGDRASIQWSAQLATLLLATQPQNAGWKQLKADALRRLGQLSMAATSRNWYIGQAQMLEGKIDPFNLPFSLVNEGTVLGSPPITFVNALRFQLDPASQGPDTSLAIRFTDIGKAYRLQLRNGIVEVTEAANGTATDLALSMSFKTWAGWIVGKVQLPAALQSGEVKLEGSPQLLNQTLARFDFARAAK